ncbi:hypothetical protein J6590_079036 [Homalodisca vitripennis]|nr:hypothetical protein J6590_079036 [Homalodisca vitripennis]
MQKVPDEVKCYKSTDTVTNIEDAVHYPQELLNSLQIITPDNDDDLKPDVRSTVRTEPCK